MDQVSEIVARQYSEYVYPEPILDMVKAIEEGYSQYGAPNLYAPLMWPEGRSLDGMKVLVAGCGTHQAAYFALTLPNATVTAIDLSLPSLQHGQFLKEKHGLGNLTLRQLNILEVGTLADQGPFDFIVCSGVLHHMADPDAGLRALASVLAPDGVMALMVYNRYARLGVYMLQDAWRRLGLQQNAEDIELIKTVTPRLPARHAVHAYVRSATDLGNDSGLVDTFLHPQDRAYTVPEVLAFARDNGLHFWDWNDRLDFSLSAVVAPNHPLHARMAKLPDEERWAVTELLLGGGGPHRFYLCHPGREMFKPNVATDADWSGFVPLVRYPGLEIVKEEGKPGRLKRRWHEFTLGADGIALINAIDNVRTITQILEEARTKVPGITEETARGFFATLQDWGHLLYATPNRKAQG
ncbi:hypothetical protein AGMMS49543_18460 [Betaproteobacteria bacterium]|nr:hypothetical protein AGMMS49543_18460 [Betaproteobacteria bacterium]GHU22191.1 hypothetical protein AGMMS50243_21300 [Betaproteobacteria bacterium]